MKENPEVTEHLEQKVIQLRSACRRAEELVALTTQPGWSEFIGRFSGRLTEIERELDAFETMPVEARSLLLKERLSYRNIVNMAGDLTDDLPRLYAELRSAETKLNERKSRQQPVYT